ncbi:DUF58 domain-containing protein [Lentisphaerota bacterium WC36G]|nr:DUF58 domain-containing protein [Lentisphaerae bacterium WC36]
MLIPKNIIYFVIIALILSLMIPFGSLALGIFIIYLVVLFAVGLFDAVMVAMERKAVQILADDNYRFNQYVAGNLMIKVQNYSANNIKIKNIYLELADEFADVKYLEYLYLEPNGQQPYNIELLPTMRGPFDKLIIYFEQISPLGLWSLSKKIELECVIKVFSDIASEQRKMASLFLANKTGSNHQQTLGQSLEFDHLREYVHGDSSNLIDWKATAKRNSLVSRVFNNENLQTVYVIIDASRLSRQYKDGRSNLDYYLASALTLASLAARNKDSFGVIVFDSNIKKFVIAKPGMTNIKICRNELFDIQAENNLPNYNKLFSFIRTKIHQRSLLFFMTDLSNSLSAEEFIADIELINKKHLCILSSLQNEKLNPLLSEIITSKELLVDKLNNHVHWHEMKLLNRTLSRNGVFCNFSNHENLSIDLVNQYLTIKRKQLL